MTTNISEKIWQFKLINYIISKKPEKKTECLKMFKDFLDEFYINVKSRMKSARSATRYTCRYLSRPAISEYRILSYDGKNVTFWYKSHETNERVEETITALICQKDLTRRVVVLLLYVLNVVQI